MDLEFEGWWETQCSKYGQSFEEEYNLSSAKDWALEGWNARQEQIITLKAKIKMLDDMINRHYKKEGFDERYKL